MRRNYASDPQKFSRCNNVLEVLYHRAKFGGGRIAPAAGAAKKVEFFVYLFVCLSVTILMPLDRGRFVVVHLCSAFSDCCQCQLATPLNAKVQKNGKNWGFSPTEGDRINRSRRNLARKHIPWVCYRTPNLALIGKRGSAQEPPKSQNLPKIVFFSHRKLTL